MAGAVLIDIPGIGQVEAKNAASEATLAEILKILKKADKETGGFKKDMGGGGAPAGGAPKKGSKGDDGSENEKAKKSVSRLGAAAQALGFAFAKVDTAVKYTAGAIGGLGKKSTEIIAEFASVGDSVTKAAGVFSGIPVIGTMFAAVAAAATGVTKAYQSAASAGATFGGSVNGFARSASAAGMTLDQFGALIAQNSFGLGAFGTTAEDGAKNFAQTSKALRANAHDLYALGYSTQQINEGLAKYGALMRTQGQQGKMTNAELASGTKNYLKELDLLSKATGEDRKTIEARQQAMALDAQFQAAMAGLGPKVRDSFMAVATGVPKGLESFTKDIMANGVATTEENQKLMAMMPQSAAMLAEFNAKTQRGETITLEERNKLNNLMKAEGTAALKNVKTAGAASAELGPMVNGLAAASTINTDALKEGAAQQTEAQKKTDEMNKKMEEAKARLAEMSNGFQMALANSGMLDLLLKAFQFVGNLVMTYVVPAFNIVSSIISTLGMTLIDVLQPAFEGVGSFFNDTLLPVFNEVAGYIVGSFIPAFAEAVGEVIENLTPAFKWLGGFISEYVVPAFKTVASFVLDNLTPILIGLGAAYLTLQAIQLFQAIPAMIAQAAATWAVVAPMLALAWPILAVIAGLTALWVLFKKAGGDLEVLGDAFRWLGSYFSQFADELSLVVLKLLNMIPGVDKKKEIEEKEEQIAKAKEERAKLEDKMADKMASNKEAALAKEQKREEKAQETTAKLAKAEHAAKTTGIKQQEEANAADKKAKEEKATIDYGSTDSLAQLKQMATKEGSAFIKDPPKTASQAAEAAKTGTVADAEKAKEALKKVTTDGKASEDTAAVAAGMNKTTTTADAGTKSKPVQQSAEELLAELNTKLGQLIKYQAQTTTNTYEQVVATRGLSGNLYKG